jgi:protein O-GlcNAc transferase
MGADYIEYIIADHTVIPLHARQFYQEKVVAMPHTYFVMDHKQSSQDAVRRGTVATSDGQPASADMPTRADFNIPEDKFVFCCFNQLYKIDPQIFDTWARILKRVSNSVLWLLRFPPDGEANIRREVRKSLTALRLLSLLQFGVLVVQAAARGLTEDQIIFTDVAPRDVHIKRGYLADLFLDTVVYNAHTTACDILWSGKIQDCRMCCLLRPILMSLCG